MTCSPSVVHVTPVFIHNAGQSVADLCVSFANCGHCFDAPCTVLLHRCKKTFFTFFMLVTFFNVFKRFFYFPSVFFIFKKRWQSSKLKAG